MFSLSLTDILIGKCILIVVSTIKKDGELYSNRELEIIGLIVENRVTPDLIKDVIKYIRINT